MLADDRGPRVRGEGELPDLQVVACLTRLLFSQPNAPNLGMTIGRVWNVLWVNRLARLPCDLRHRNNSFHRANVRQLWRSQHYVSDRIDAGLGGLHPAIGFYEASIRLDSRLLQSNAFGARFASNRDQNLLRFDLLLLAAHRKSHGNSRFRLFNFLDLGPGMKIDGALPVHARELFGDVFIFHRNQTRQHFQNRDFGIEGAENRSEFHAHGACAHDDQRLRNFLQTENLNVREHACVRLQAWNHAGFRAGSQDDIFRLYGAALAAVRDLDRQETVLRRAGQLAVALDRFDFTLAHQEFKALGVFSNDLRFTLLNCRPV